MRARAPRAPEAATPSASRGFDLRLINFIYPRESLRGQATRDLHNHPAPR